MFLTFKSIFSIGVTDNDVTGIAARSDRAGATATTGVKRLLPRENGQGMGGGWGEMG
jgi:hypothetical protein